MAKDNPLELPRDSNDPAVYAKRRNGEIKLDDKTNQPVRMRSFSCAKCILNKKSCSGTAPKCSRCGSDVECSFDTAAVAAAIAKNRQRRPEPQSPKSPRAPNVPKAPKFQQATDVSASRSRQDSTLSARRKPHTSSAEQDDSKSALGTRSSQTAESNSVTSNMRTKPASIVAPQVLKTHNTRPLFTEINLTLRPSDMNRVLEAHQYNKLIEEAKSKLEQEHKRRYERILRQRRSIKAMSIEDIEAVGDSAIRKMIDEYYDGPFSTTLFQFAQEIAKSIRDESPTATDDIVYGELLKRWEMIWDLFLAYYEDPWGKVAEWTARMQMNEQQKVAYLRPQLNMPTTELDAQEFLFCYICISMNGWRSDPDLVMARWCYLQYIDEDYDYFKDALEWRDGIQMVDGHAEWLIGELQERMAKDNRLVKVSDKNGTGFTIRKKFVTGLGPIKNYADLQDERHHESNYAEAHLDEDEATMADDTTTDSGQAQTGHDGSLTIRDPLLADMDAAIARINSALADYDYGDDIPDELSGEADYEDGDRGNADLPVGDATDEGMVNI